MSRHPEVKWAQRADKVYITVLLSDAKNAKVDLQPDGVFTFTATAGMDGNAYEVKLNLLDKVNVEESKINIGARNIFCVVEKAEKGWWKKLLSGDAKTPHYLKVDWDKWADEDEEGPAARDVDLGGMDFSNFGAMGGMGGLGGMGGMGGLGGMGGMGGLGGMGGMGGMEGMGGMDDEFDDSDEEQEPETTGDAEKTAEVSTEAKTEAAPAT
ncbi:Uncharacterized protein M6B38_209455 [Iris pallida]|uniref:Co-chaperone protein p23 n=1 Tax=Iris pallida TaxID=29817 RepID=A0AAX6E546_IRIPA|nr:Uncharacterized protein M6B38_209455 [Iris pallida]